MSNNGIFSLTTKLKCSLITFIAYYSLLPYFLWARSYVLLALVSCLVLVQLAGHKKILSRSKHEKTNSNGLLFSISFWVLLFSYIFVIKNENIKNIIGNAITLFYPIIVILTLDLNEKKYVFNQFLNLYCVTVFVSLIFYLLFIFGVPLPHGILYHPSFDGYAYFDNYHFFIFVYDPRSAIFPRFQSVFTEPGHVGMYSAFFLFANKYKRHDKRTWILIASLIFSLSLAAYVLFVIGVLIFCFMKSNNKVKISLVLTFFVICSFFATKVYYEKYPDAVFSKWVLGRVFDDEKSNVKISDSLSGRSSDVFKKEYALQKENPVDYIFGKGARYFGEHIGAGTASAEVFIFQNGLLGVFVLSLFYLYYLTANYSSVGLGFLVFYFLSFLQRPVALSFYQLLLYIVVIPIFNTEYRTIKKSWRIILL